MAEEINKDVRSQIHKDLDKALGFFPRTTNLKVFVKFNDTFVEVKAVVVELGNTPSVILKLQEGISGL